MLGIAWRAANAMISSIRLTKKRSAPTSSAPVRALTRFAKAASISRSVLAFNLWTFRPMAGAAASTSPVVTSNTGLFGFSRKPTVAMLGTSSCNSASPLRSEFTDEPVEGRQGASWPIEASNKPELHRVSADIEHNWDARRRSLGRESRKRARCDDYSHSKLDQISRQRWQPISLVSCPAIFDHQVPAF